MTFFLEPDYWNWFLLAFVLLILELLVPGVYLMWFGLGALVTGFILVGVGDIHWALETLLFCVLSGISVALGYRLTKARRGDEASIINQGLNDKLGRRGTLETAIVNGKGRVMISGVSWIAYGPDLPEGTSVIVTGIEDGTFVVKPLEDTEKIQIP